MAKPCSSVSLSGSVPVELFHAHWLRSCGSLLPPPVKMSKRARFVAIQVTAAAPFVFEVVLQSEPVTW